MKIIALSSCVAITMAHAFAQENGKIKIYDAQFANQSPTIYCPGQLIIDDGIKIFVSTPINAIKLNQNLEKIRDFYAEEFNYRSWDNKGSDIVACINLNNFSTYHNAAWIENGLFFSMGNSKELDLFETALDIVAHEYTHGVIRKTSKLQYEGQSGALDEHLADVFAVIINQRYNNLSHPYLIGSSVFNGNCLGKNHFLRDMMDPSKGPTLQASHMADLNRPEFRSYGPNCRPMAQNDYCGVHSLSGIPNKVAALIISAIGHQEAAKLFFPVMTHGLSRKSNFNDYKKALLIECKKRISDTCDIVTSAFNSVGL